MKKRLKTFLIVSGALLFIAAITNLITAKFNFRFLFMCGASCVIILYGVFYEKLAARKRLTYTLVSLCACVLISVISLDVYGKIDNVTYGEDAVIVLGAGIKGENVTELLAYRLQKAIEFSMVNPDAFIVVSGGQGPDEDISEALAMERYLIRRGIPPEKILREEASTSTYENLMYSKEILDSLFDGPYEVTIVTNDFHIFRAVGIAGKLGLAATHFHARTNWYSVPLNYSRECLAIVKFWIFGR